MSDALLVTREPGVLTLQFNRPAKKNALTQDMYAAAADGLGLAEEDAGVRVVVIQGSEGCFTAGNDIDDFMRTKTREDMAQTMRFLSQLRRFPKPLVALVDGMAIGVGTTLLLHCDFVLVTDRARLRMPFVELGLVPEAASSLLLPNLVGLPKASALLMLGETLSGSDAVALGMAYRCVVPAGLGAAGADVVGRLRALPPASLRQTKRLLKDPQSAGVEAQLEAEAEIFFACLQSPEAAEAMRAFKERRAPDFSSFS